MNADILLLQRTLLLEQLDVKEAEAIAQKWLAEGLSDNPPVYVKFLWVAAFSLLNSSYMFQQKR